MTVHHRALALAAAAALVLVAGCSDSATTVPYDFNATCGVIPDSLDTFRDVFPGGTITGNVCWAVAADDVDTPLLVVDEALTFDGDRAFNAVR